jgi:uncharacterized protein (TIGR03790 family)
MLAWAAAAVTAHAAGQGDEVVVVFNTRVPESRDVAEHYAAMRNVPESQVLGFDLPDGEDISRRDFRELLQKPLTKALEDKGLFKFTVEVIPETNSSPRRVDRKLTAASIRYLVLCYGVPLRIDRDTALHEEGEEKVPEPLRRNEAAVDNELACLPLLEENMLLSGPRPNPFYGTTNASKLNPTNGILLVARLDGPSGAIARALVDKAMEAETNGLWGRAYFDMRGLTEGTYKQGDDWIRGAAEVCTSLGIDTVVDTNAGTFPAAFPLSQVEFYAGWYDENVSGPFARPTVEFMPGAFAYHLQSFSAATLRSTKRQWVGPLLARGVTATMGCVDEPFLGGTPNIGVFFARFTYSGFSFGEAAYASQNYVSWQTTVVGDPLYRPFRRSLKEWIEDLNQRHNKLVEWAYVRIINTDLLHGAGLERVIAATEKLEQLKTSAVLQEKLADLYQAQGKPSSSIYALQQVLKLDSTPEQRDRVMLTLAHWLIAQDRDSEAYEVYQEFIKEFPDYPDQNTIYRLLLNLADKLGKKDDATKYQGEINQINSLHSELEKRSLPKHGI